MASWCRGRRHGQTGLLLVHWSLRQDVVGCEAVARRGYPFPEAVRYVICAEESDEYVC